MIKVFAEGPVEKPGSYFFGITCASGRGDKELGSRHGIPVKLPSGWSLMYHTCEPLPLK